MRDILYEVSGLLPEPVKISISKELIISEDIDHEVDIAAKQYGYWAILSEKAESRYQKLKFHYESWKAGEESDKIRNCFVEKIKSPTEAQMKSHIMSQPKYKLYQNRLQQFDEDRRILKVIAKAFELKKDLVQTKSSNRRTELKGSR